jgi:hypothetical protein
MEQSPTIASYIISVLILVAAIVAIGCLTYWFLHTGPRNITYVRSLLSDQDSD